MITNSLAILNQIKDQVTTATSSLLPTATISLDEPIDLVYDNLPEICIYPISEDLIYDESFSEDKNQLSIRIEIRLVSGPASVVCTPILNAIGDNLKSDLRLNGLSDYLEIQRIQWANDKTADGNVCGASIDLQVNYLV